MSEKGVKWEYKIVSLSDGSNDEYEEIMNKLGDKGWELAGVRLYNSSTAPDLYFKRPKRTRQLNKG